MDSERELIRKNIEFIKASKELNQYKIFNNEYTKLTDKLNLIDQQVSDITGYVDLNMEALMDELKFSVIYKHFTKTKDIDTSSILSVGAWCGKGTQVYKNLQEETPETLQNTEMIQMICRQHDLNYFHAKTRQDVHKADVEMLLSIIDTYVMKGSKDAIYNLTSGDINQFKDYIFDTLYKIVDKPGDVATDIYNGLTSATSSSKALDIITGKADMLSVASNIGSLKERVLGMVAFGGIGMKLLYDLGLGKNEYVDEKGELTNNVYGWEKTDFKLEDVDYIIRDIEHIQNLRLQQAGYENINFDDLLKFNVDELEYKFEEDKKLLEEEEEQYEYEERVYGEEDEYDEIDFSDLEEFIDPRERQYLNDLLELLEQQDLE
jgi:hypothetical protein